MYGTVQFCTLRYNFLNYDVFFSLNVVLILAKIADTICQSIRFGVSSMQRLMLVMAAV